MVDLAYLEAHPQHLPTLLHHQRIRETPVSGGSICTASRLTLDDGASLFLKTRPGAPPDFFPAEANGLRWLAETGAVTVPTIIFESPDMLALEWIEAGEPTARAAERLGRELAAMHRFGAPAFGAPWPGFIGALPMANSWSTAPWPAWFAEHRLQPALATSADRAAFTQNDIQLVQRVLANIDRYGGDEAPSRIHGDLWPGNVMFGRDGRAWLIDPAAHGGHRETDLALLGLFGGVPMLDRVLAAYREAWPLADGWRERVPLHRLHLMLVHTALFGSAYRDAVMAEVHRL
jgi:fructosamine-3-kinase